MKPNIGTPRPIGSPKARPCSKLHCPDQEFRRIARFARSPAHQGMSSARLPGPLCRRVQERGRNAEEHQEDVRNRGPLSFASKPGNPLGARYGNLPQPRNAVDDGDTHQVVEKVRDRNLVRDGMGRSGNCRRCQKRGYRRSDVGAERERVSMPKPITPPPVRGTMMLVVVDDDCTSTVTRVSENIPVMVPFATAA